MKYLSKLQTDASPNASKSSKSQAISKQRGRPARRSPVIAAPLAESQAMTLLMSNEQFQNTVKSGGGRATPQASHAQNRMRQITQDSKLFPEESLFLNTVSNKQATQGDPSKVLLDLRLPSQKLFQDNMLSILRLLNNHPFSGVLKVSEITKNDISLQDLPAAIKSGTISRTNQFEYLLSRIFMKCQDRLSYLHESVTKIVDEQRAKFIQNSQPVITQGLLAVKDPHERLSLLKECGIIDQEEVVRRINEIQANSVEGQGGQSGATNTNFTVFFTANDADKVLKLRRLLIARNKKQ